jgi:hypothetical protein
MSQPFIITSLYGQKGLIVILNFTKTIYCREVHFLHFLKINSSNSSICLYSNCITGEYEFAELRGL